MPAVTLGQATRLSWDIQGPVEVRDGDSLYWEIRISELPDFFVAGENRDEVLNEFLPALRAFLQTYIDRGEMLPAPKAPGAWKYMQMPSSRPVAVSSPAQAASTSNAGKTQELCVV